MIPLRDENPSGSSPVLTRLIIIANCFLFGVELLQGAGLREFLYTWGFVPSRLTMAVRQGEEPLLAPVLTLATSTFLHGGWLHLIGNMWFLWIFGDNVEDRLGKLRFLLFYIAAGMAAGWAHYLTAPFSSVPTVGASGAIAAVLGAYAVTFPGARVITLIPIFFFFEIVALPALLVLGIWFAMQFLSGFVSFAAALSGAGGAGGGIAWWAHIGGFIFGALVMKAFAKRRRRTRVQEI